MSARTESGDEANVYDWWSRHPRAFDLLYTFAFLGREREIRSRSFETLDLEPGEWILEIGCGPGNSFESIRSSVGSTGTVVGIDASRGMVREARDRVLRTERQNVHAVHGDALRPPVEDESFDAISASMSLSAIPDPEKAVATAETLLRPGGRFVVLDGQPFQKWRWTLANTVVVPVTKRTTDWCPEVDIPAALRREFETVDIETFNAGTVVLACAQKAPQ